MELLKKKRFWFSLSGVLAAGLLSGLATQNAAAYYQQLKLPSFAPPGWLFAPVWLILYALLGISLALILGHREHHQRKILLFLFSLQLLLNLLWPLLFFSLKNDFLAVLVIALLWLFLLNLLFFAYRWRKNIFWLNLPYFIWISFATVLNVAVLILNDLA